MSSFLDPMNFYIPWWLWTAPAAVAIFGFFTIARRFLGVEAAIKAALALGSVLIARLSYQRGKQHGWRERIKKEEENAQNTAIKASITRVRTRARLVHTGQLRQNDGFKRKD